MSNNTQLNTNVTSGDIISDDQITTLNDAVISTGEKVQRVKLSYGLEGSASDVGLNHPLPVVSDVQRRMQEIQMLYNYIILTEEVSHTERYNGSRDFIEIR